MVKKLIILAIALIYIVSCQPKEASSKFSRFTESDLPSSITLSGKKYNLDFVVNPAQILLKDSIIIIAEKKSTNDDKIHILDRKSKKLIRNLGIDGVGPGEITIGYPLMDNGVKNEFWVYDGQQLKFCRFSLLDTSKLAVEQIRGLEIPGFITKATFTSSTNLLTTLVDGWGKYYEFSIEMDTIASFGNWKDMIANSDLPRKIKPEDLDANIVSNIFSGKLNGNLRNNIYVFAGNNVGYLDIIDLNNKEIKTIWGPDLNIPEFEVRYDQGFQMPQFDLRTLTIKYLDVYVGQASIFLLYSGKNFKDISSEERLNRVFEIDFNGKLLNQFQLDYPLYGFTVDEDSKLIYGLTTDKDPNLVEFQY
ncbi:BF3164 family lipoprotein [Algoriphagus sp. D3-2-R+10]|uniref:BF3164 family lipoprotein n=1 Tax=Algoriphagus aurantiacus TaxID=3103948 RepID=UPI002B392223|nr:BF3164 family lipoprotein [Algoriphagus sp. D3-2-R+10]MEB2776212.1 BF3164 family lipoprotein [Algoriphagus sp. D3-2-R+10]